MVLVDTSVWVDHLRRGDPVLAGLLEEAMVLSHPYVIGELACGNLGNREEVLSLLGSLPDIRRPDDDEVLFFIDRERLHGGGLGYVDVSLLAACRLHGIPLYTRDAPLNAVSRRLGTSFVAP